MPDSLQEGSAAPAEQASAPDPASSPWQNLHLETAAEQRVKQFAPWFVSLAVHAGVILLAVFITWTVSHLPASSGGETVLVVADFNALNFVANPGLDPSSTEKGGNEQPLETLQPFPQGKSVAEQLSGAQSDVLKAISNLGQHSDSQASSGAMMTSFLPQTGPNSATFGGVTGTNARRIAYVIDASGSMVMYLQFVINELTRSLANLSPQQSFAIIFFSGTQLIEVPPAGQFTPATDEDRARALQWIKANVIARSNTDPVIGLQRAIELKPDVIFLLSQDINGFGEFEVDQRDLLEMLESLNPVDPQTGRRATQINCIQFLQIDALETMQKITQAHGSPKGFRFISPEDLGLAPR